MRSSAAILLQRSEGHPRHSGGHLELDNKQPAVDPLVALSLSEFSVLTRLIYEGPFESPPWHKSLKALLELFEACHVTLILRPATPEVPSVTVIANPRGVKIHRGEYCHYDVFSLDPFIKLPVDKVVTVDDVVGAEKWVGCEFYKQFVAPAGIRYILGADIRTSEGVECRLRICRGHSDPSFDVADYALCKALLPHFKQAVHIHAHVGRLDAERLTYVAAIDRMLFGTVILNETGNVIETSGVARIILSERDGLHVVRDTLRATCGQENQALQHIIKGALPGAGVPSMPFGNVISITRPSGRAKLGILVRAIPLGETSEGRQRPAVAVFLRSPELQSETSHDVIRQLFGLTPAEAALSVLVANGLTLLEAANELSICKNTARAHVRSIFSKTNVTRQTELVRLILSSVATLG